MRFLKVPTVRVVKENDKGQPEEIEILDPDGKVLERETYVYDEHGMQKRNTFDAEGKLLAYEVWTREPDGKLAQHELHQGDGKPIYIEKWTRDADGKLLHAEAWAFDPEGNQAGYRKLMADERGRLVPPGRNAFIWFIRFVSMGIGVWCMFTMLSAYAAGQIWFACFAGAIMLLNFWSAVKKR